MLYGSATVLYYDINDQSLAALAGISAFSL
jgi:hypothetical protein